MLGEDLKSVEVKKERAMWNQMKPGDKYDVRRSMIMKVSSEKREFMGNKLPLVCLLQAAEIERLMDCLDDYRIKCKEIDNVQLDRHSYEIQIKELHDKLSDSEGFKKQLARTREFSQKQQNQNASSRKIFQEEINKYKSNYAKALNQISAERSANTSLFDQNKLLKRRLEAEAKTKAREMDELRTSLQSAQRNDFERERRDMISRLEQERNELMSRTEQERSLVVIEMKKLHAGIAKRDMEIQENKRVLEDHLRKAKQYAQISYKIQSEQQNKQELSRQVDRLNAELRERNNQLRAYRDYENEANFKIKSVETELERTKNVLSNIQQEKHEMELRFGEINTMKKIKEQFRQNLEMSEMERQRLTKTIRVQSDNLEKKNDEIVKMELVIATLNQKVKTADVRSSEAQSLSEQLRQYETRISKMNQQILILENHISQHEITTKEYQKLKIRFSDLDRKSHSIEDAAQDLSRTNAQLSVTLEARNRQIEQLKVQMSENENLVRQFKKIKEGLQRSELENRDLHSQLKEREERIRLSGAQAQRVTQQKEENILRLQQKQKLAQELNRQLQSLVQQREEKEEFLRKAQEEMRLSSTTQRQLQSELIQRSEQIKLWEKKISSINSENKELKEEVMAAKQGMRNSSAQVSRLANEITRIQQENEMLRPKATELIEVNRKLNAYKNQLEQASTEITRLNRIIQVKDNQIQGLGGHVQSKEEQIRYSSAQFLKLNSELNEYKMLITENNKESETYKNRINKLLAENNSQCEDLYAAQQNIRISASKIDKINNQLKIVCNQKEQLESQGAEMIRKIKESQHKNYQMMEQITRLNTVVDRKNGEIKMLRQKTGSTEQYTEQLLIEKKKIIEQVNEYKMKLTENSEESETYKMRIEKIMNENRDKSDKLNEMQQGLRLSASKIQQINNELKIVCNQKEQIEEGLNEANKRNKELEARLGMAAKQIERLNDIIGKKNTQIKNISNSLKEAQGELNNVSSQQSKTIREVNEFKTRLTESNQESQTYKLRINKLIAESNAKGDDLREAQQNLRLSASKIDKINNQLKIVCNQNEELLQKIQQFGEVGRRLNEADQKNAILSEQIERFNAVLEKKYIQITNLTKRLSETQEMAQTIGVLQEKVTQLVTVNNNLKKNLAEYQEKTTHTTGQNQKYLNQVKECRDKISQNETLNSQLTIKVQKMVSENTFLSTQFRTVQQNLRVSSATQAKLTAQLTSYRDQMDLIARENETMKQKIKKLMQANNLAMEDIQKAQETARQSSLQTNRVNAELGEIKSRQEREAVSYQQRIQQVMLQNTHMSEERQKIQEDLRLSNNAFGKQRNEMRDLIDQHQLLKKKYSESLEAGKQLNAAEQKLVMLVQEVDRLSVLIQKRDQELNSLRGQVASAEEGLRQSTLQQNRTANELSAYRDRVTESNSQSQTYRARLQKLQKEFNENQEEVHGVQQKLRQSTSQFGKLNNEFKMLANQKEELQKRLQESEEQRKKISGYQPAIDTMKQQIIRLNTVLQRKNIEISSLRGEAGEAREALRYSSVQQSKANQQMMSLQSKLTQSSLESQTYKGRIQKILNQNKEISDTLYTSQEEVRLSASKLAKLNNELKIVCNQNEELKQRMDECINFQKKTVGEAQTRLMVLSQEIERLNLKLQEKYNDISNFSKKWEELMQVSASWEEKANKLYEQKKNMEGSIRTAQEHARTVTAEQSKIAHEIKMYQERIDCNDEENNNLKAQIVKIQQENDFYSDELKGAQERLRLSANTQLKLNSDLAEIRARIESNDQDSQSARNMVKKLKSENISLSEELSRAIESVRISSDKIQRLSNELEDTRSAANQQAKNYENRLQNLVGENKNYHEGILEAQEKVRLSASTISKLNSQIGILRAENEESKKKIRQLQELARKASTFGEQAVSLQDQNTRLKNVISQKNNQIKNLGGIVAEAEESVRQSSLKQNRISSELNEFKLRLTESQKDSETYQQRIQKILLENKETSLHLQESQESVRLSNSQLAKLNTELKIVCNQNEELKQKLKESFEVNKKVGSYEQSLTQAANEVQRLNAVIERKNMEIRSLGGQVTEVQQNLRLSTQTQRALNQQLLETKKRQGEFKGEIDSYKLNINKIKTQYAQLNEHVQSTQSKLKQSSLSATEQIRELKDRTATFEQQNALLKDNIQKLSSERTTLRERLTSLEQKMNSSTITIKKLTEIKIEYESKIQQWQKISQQLQRRTAEVRELKSEIEHSQELKRQVLVVQTKLKQVGGENESLLHDLQTGQEQIRLSGMQNSKMRSQLQNSLQLVSQLQLEIEKLNRKTANAGGLEAELSKLQEELTKKNIENKSLSRRLGDIEETNKSISTLQQKINKLASQNFSYEQEIRNAQDQMRISSSAQGQLVHQINEYKMQIDQNLRDNEELKQKINRLSGQNNNLSKELVVAQDSMRLSAGNQKKLAIELREAQLKVEESNLESETYKKHLEKINHQNRALNENVREAQEQMRLSAGQMARLNNELKISSNEVEELRRRLEDALKYKSKATQSQEKVYEITNELQKIKKASGAVESESQSSKQKIQDYKTKMSSLTEQFEKLNKILQGLRVENKSLKDANYDLERRVRGIQNTEQKIRFLVAEVKRLEEDNTQKERDLSELRIKFSDEVALMKRIQEHLALFVILFAEIESLRKRIKDKEREVHEVRQTSLRLAQLNQV